MKNLLVLVALLPIMVIGLFSQSYPEKTMSIGFQVTQGEFAYGPNINYAYNQNIHVGMQLGLYYDTGYKNNSIDVIKSNFFFYFAPYVRYYLQNIKNFRPFVQGQFGIYTVESKVNSTPVPQNSPTARYDGNNIWINVGGSWFPFNNLSVNAGMRFIDYNLEKSWIRAGLGNPFIGIDWYIQ